MKVSKLILAVMFLPACSLCPLKYPLDGKAQSWCERQENGEKYCGHQGVKELEYSYVKCGKGR